MDPAENSGSLPPRSPAPESTLRLLRRPYDYVREVCETLGVDVFQTRLLLRRTICMRGASAAELFYDADRFVRSNAMPEPVRATLLGKGGVQGLDDGTHRHRKAMFMALVEPARVRALGDEVEDRWLAAARSWASSRRVFLYEALHPVLADSVCAWAGVPLPRATRPRRVRDLVLMFDRAAAMGLGHLKARAARVRSEKWLAQLVTDVREGRVTPGHGTALASIARHHELNGSLLSPRIAAVELLNVLRPTVAVSVFITFVAHALHVFPDRAPSDPQDEQSRLDFAQEVRRYYPFFPAVIARTRRAFLWRGVMFPDSTRCLLDIHGTNNDPDIWELPDQFRPERFRDRRVGAYELIPQGGGDHLAGHRCPGEAITLELMQRAVRLLTGELSYQVPQQDLRIDRSRLPALPRSRMVLGHVRVRGSVTDR